MTVPERVVVAFSGDRESAQLWWDQLADLRVLREEGRTPRAGRETPAGAPPPALLLEQACCPTCLHDLDDENFCPGCGRLENDRERPLPLSGEQGRSQKETS